MLDDEAYRSIVWRAGASPAIVTAVAAGTRAGCLVTYHGQCSIDPPRYAVWLSPPNFTYGVAKSGRFLGVHFLRRQDDELARLFGEQTGNEVDKFATCRWHSSPEGLPLVDAVPDRIVLEIVSSLAVPDGDHECFIGVPLRAESQSDEAFMEMASLRDLHPGHPA